MRLEKFIADLETVYRALAPLLDQRVVLIGLDAGTEDDKTLNGAAGTVTDFSCTSTGRLDVCPDKDQVYEVTLDAGTEPVLPNVRRLYRLDGSSVVPVDEDGFPPVRVTVNMKNVISEYVRGRLV